MRISLLVFVFCLILPSCDTIDFSDQPQGVIEYEVTYLSNRSSMPTNLLPKKVTLKYRSHKSITTIEGFMGMFSMSNICDFRKNTNTMILKVMDKKFYYPGEKYEPPFFFDGLKNVSISFTDKTKILAGLPCKNSIISFPNSKRTAFNVYYTDQISIKNANKSNPFNSINGVLMQFNININNIEMQLIANKYKHENVSNDIFSLPKGYKKVSREKISGILSRLLE